MGIFNGLKEIFTPEMKNVFKMLAVLIGFSVMFLLILFGYSKVHAAAGDRITLNDLGDTGFGELLMVRIQLSPTVTDRCYLLNNSMSCLTHAN